MEGGGEVAEVVQHCGEVHAADCDGGMIGAEVAQVGDNTEASPPELPYLSPRHYNFPLEQLDEQPTEEEVPKNVADAITRGDWCPVKRSPIMTDSSGAKLSAQVLLVAIVAGGNMGVRDMGDPNTAG